MGCETLILVVKIVQEFPIFQIGNLESLIETAAMTKLPSFLTKSIRYC